MRSGEVKSADEDAWMNGFLADMVGIIKDRQIGVYMLIMRVGVVYV